MLHANRQTDLRVGRAWLGAVPQPMRLSAAMFGLSVVSIALLTSLSSCVSTPPVSAVTEAKVEAKTIPDARQAKPSSATTVDRYKFDVAKHIYLNHADWLFDGPPPAALTSVVVLSVTVTEQGTPSKVAVLRSNGFKELELRAVESVRTAAPLPQPSRAVLKRGIVEYSETWLFRADGKFQIRTLAEAQASAND